MTLIKHYVSEHRHALQDSWQRLLKTPLSTLLIIAVVAIAMTLPAGLKVLLNNARTVSLNWNKGETISLYLKQNLTPTEQEALLQNLKQDPSISNARYISPEEGLAEFKKNSGLTPNVNQLDQNPLPPVVVITPSAALPSPTAIDALSQKLSNLPNIASVDLDMTWVKRLYYFLDFLTRIEIALALLFGFGVILITSNTIRLAMESSRKEINILKLFGASDAFVRRPFLYLGTLYGFLGSLLAYAMIVLFLLFLESPVKSLAHSYQSDFLLQSLNIKETLLLFIGGGFLGWLGAMLALRKYLHTKITN